MFDGMPTPVPDPYSLPAFIISIVGLIVASIAATTSIVALIWQIMVRTRGAHRVLVEATSSMNLLGAGGAAGPYVQITIRNRGAAPVEVSQWAIEKNDGSGKSLTIAIPAPFPPQPELPHMLQAGSSVSFLVIASALKAEFGAADPSSARPVAYLSTGQIVRGKPGMIRFDS